MEKQILLQTNEIVKEFGPTVALNHVSFTLEAGVIHGLIGENGSGKSTLASIIAGAQQADGGTMALWGEEYRPQSAIEASTKKVCMIVQEQGTFSSVTVAANIFIGKETLFTKKGIIDLKKMYAAAKEILGETGAGHIDERAYTASLSFEDRKLIEIARAMYARPDILIVDETTTALSKNGRDILYKLINRIREQGKSVIFISHDIEEVMEICDKVAVLRDGVYVETLAKEGFSESRIKTLMVGREVEGHFYRADYDSTWKDEVLLRLENVTGHGVSGVSLEVHEGEILGIGGLTDCGMHALGKIAFGLKPPDLGHVVYRGREEILSAGGAMKCRIGYISKNRDRESLMTASSIKDNICLPSLSKLKKGGLITGRSERSFARKWAEVLSVKMNNIDQYVMYLSGGNKQKVALAKWLGFEAETFILDCPTRGIDIGVKQAIYELMMELKQKGCAILMISEELPELIGMCDRIVIMKKGSVSGEFARSEALSENELIHHMI